MAEEDMDHMDVEVGEDAPEESEETLAEQSQQKENEVNRLVTASAAAQALKVAIVNPPYASKNQETKSPQDKAANAVLTAIEAIKDSEIDKTLGDFDSDELDVIMKYVYRGLAQAKNCASLLKWHDKITTKCGSGCIVRVLAERKVV